MPWSDIKFSQLIHKGNVWRSVWRICMWILGLNGLRHLKCLWVKYRRFAKDYKQIIQKLLPNKQNNKNALNSIESCLLGDNFCCQRRLLFRLEYKTIVICHNVNTQNVKIARRDRPHILASNQPVWNLWKPSTYWYCSIEENSFRYFTLKTLNNDVYRYQEPMTLLV